MLSRSVKSTERKNGVPSNMNTTPIMRNVPPTGFPSLAYFCRSRLDDVPKDAISAACCSTCTSREATTFASSSWLILGRLGDEVGKAGEGESGSVKLEEESRKSCVIADGKIRRAWVVCKRLCTAHRHRWMPEIRRFAARQGRFSVFSISLCIIFSEVQFSSVPRSARFTYVRLCWLL